MFQRYTIDMDYVCDVLYFMRRGNFRNRFRFIIDLNFRLFIRHAIRRYWHPRFAKICARRSCRVFFNEVARATP